MGPVARRAAPAVVAAICVMVGGCSGGAEGETASEPIVVRPGSPEEVLATLGETLPEARRKRDCEGVEELNRRSPVTIVCPPYPQARKALVGLELVDSARFGPRAVIDHRAAGAQGDGTSVMFETPDGEWGLSRFGLAFDTSASSADTDREQRDEAVARYLAAVRERDCEEWIRWASTTSSDVKTVCQRQFRATRPTAELLRANPDAAPEYLGGNADLGFYGLRTSAPTPGYRTIAVMSTPESSLRPYEVLDVLESGAP
jgi:hypothetical protein